jgi:hypothetical protein
LKTVWGVLINPLGTARKKASPPPGPRKGRLHSVPGGGLHEAVGDTRADADAGTALGDGEVCPMGLATGVVAHAATIAATKRCVASFKRPTFSPA